MVLIEDCQVPLSHNYEEEAEEYYIPPPSLLPMTTPHLGNHYLPHSILNIWNSYCYLFCDTITPPLCNIHHNRSLLKVRQVTNISPQVEEGVIQGVRWQRKDTLEDGDSGLLNGIDVTMEFGQCRKDILKGAPSFGDSGWIFTALNSTEFCFTSSCFILFSVTMWHWASKTAVI